MGLIFPGLGYVFFDIPMQREALTTAVCCHTVKRVDEVVPHRHLVTQDQTTQVSNKFLDDNRQTYCLQMSN